jgi:tetratricopeptide (TPR) repeat protein
VARRPGAATLAEVDSGSTDGSAEAVAAPVGHAGPVHIRVPRNASQGSARAVNQWIAAAAAERLGAVLLAVVIAAVYANSFSGGFHFDDHHALEHNPFIRSLANIPRFFLDSNTTTVLRENKDLRPILLVTFAINYAISGMATWSYHGVNLLLHWLAAMLVFRIVRDHLWLGDNALPVAAAAALVVAVHPLNTEPVDYLSARSALLTTVLYLAAFDAGVRTRRVTCLVLFTLAMLTKAVAMTLPLTVAGYWLLARRQRLPAAAPSWGLLAGLVGIAGAGILYRALLVPPWVVHAAHEEGVTPWIYCMTEWSAYLYYLRLFLWPDMLVVDRLKYPIASSFLQPQAWASLLALAVLGALAWRARRRCPALTFAAFWFFVTLAAESTFFPLAEPVNEHRPYLAMLGLGTAAGVGLWWLAGRLRTAPTATFGVLTILIASALSAATIQRNAVWRDDYALWLDATEKVPENPRAWLNAGHAAMVDGNLVEARRLLLEARRLNPNYAYVQINLSALEVHTGALEESLRWADEAVHANSGLALTHHYRGAALERLGRLDEALEEYRKTTAIDAQNSDAWFAEGNLLEQRQAWAPAAAAYEHALAADPTRAEAAMKAALLYQYQLADPAHAVELYRTVLRLVPTHYGAHYQLAVALLATGKKPEALITWRAFVAMARAIGDQASINEAPAALRNP